VGPEWIIVGLIAIGVLFGAKKIPEMARSVGKAQGEFKKGIREGAVEEQQAQQAQAQQAQTQAEPPSPHNPPPPQSPTAGAPQEPSVQPQPTDGTQS
jgi:TatA/E family protein of Tat protein translocase